MNDTKFTNTKAVMLLGLLMWLVFAWITWKSPAFAYEIPNRERPILLVTFLLIAVSILSLVALWRALKVQKPNRDFVIFTFLFAIAFRLIQLFAHPFQEIDNYRYIWDGIVLSKGHSPYRFSPYQVLHELGQPGQGDLESVDPDAEKTRGTVQYHKVQNLERDQLREIAFRTGSTTTIVSRIHYSHVRTVYPPASQLVFGCTMSLVPKDSSVAAYIIAIKTAITLFDLGTLFLLAYLLSLLKKNVLWSMAYGWNPLVIKEFANSGHLDSIAVFFTLLAVVFIVKALGGHEKSAPHSRPGVCLLFSGLFMALGFAAKIFPIILVPFIACTVWRNVHWKQGMLFGGSFLVFSTLFMLPMVLEMGRQASEKESAMTNKEGLTTFLRHWQINEFAYMVVYQNLKEMDADRELNVPWFRIQNEFIRKSILKPVIPFTGKEDAPYYLSRGITLGVFVIFYAWLVYVLFKRPQNLDDSLLSGCFLILAVFFCLQPTQNPWYWTWAVPFLPFARNRIWLGYSVVLFIYYFRFWFAQLDGSYSFLGFQYSGVGIFDYVIVWLEHLPILLAVLWGRILLCRKQEKNSPQ